ncbi:unnamed protein product [Allacma fusca]|uniref:CUB-like domain-containing protein n=1 Tax=Allacma fusca TaxID=39272 RepID=A0A8J2NUL4_9HEXA|nr:unnamed protein product [Allacma fusca]
MEILLFIFIGVAAFNGVLAVKDWDEYKECGGIVPLSMAYPTTIAYKEDETYNSTEFCIWTLLPEENIKSVTIAIRHQFNDLGDGIVAYFWNSTELWSQKIPHDEFVRLTFEPPPIFLAFSSDPVDQSVGFSINIYPSGTPGLTRGRAFHFEKDEGEFSYPRKTTGEEKYENNERVSLVVQGVTGGDAQRMRKIVVKSVDTQPDSDFVSVYTLFRYYDEEPNFLPRGRFSGNQTGEFPISSYYPTVYFFTSDDKITGKGFTTEWKNYRHKSEL